MFRIIIFNLLAILLSVKALSQEKKPEDGLGVSFATNYTFSGIGLILAAEWQNKHHIFYTGPKLQLSKTYLPMEGPRGWNIGYRHEYNKAPEKFTSFFFNIDYQIGLSKPFSRTVESKKINFVHEAFVGYGVQFRLSSRLYLANVLGVGGYLESYYNTDLDLRKTFTGYNNLFKFFLNYKF
jgi:hypothetical protein